MIALAALALAAAPAETSACVWNYPRDLPLVETHARFWRADVTLAPGERLLIAGQFPRARQMSFNVYRRADNAMVAAVGDTALASTGGGANPFRPGAHRDGRARDFRVTVGRAEDRPDVALPGVAPDAPFEARLLYRIYLPDAAAPGGGGALPAVSAIAHDGSTRRIGGRCPDPATVDPRQPVGPTRVPRGPGDVADPLDWRVSNIASGQGTGDVLVNRENSYAYAPIDSGRGDLLVLRGRAPTHPITRGGARRMGSGNVRYWSICAYPEPPDRTAACIADEDIPLGRDREYVIVAGPADKRPTNARAACGIAWLPLPAAGQGFLLLRHVAPDATFAFTPARATTNYAAPTLGPFTPRGTYRSIIEVETIGCPVQHMDSR